MRVFNCIDFVCVLVLPMLLIIVFNTIIAVRVWSGTGFRRHMTSQQHVRSSNKYVFVVVFNICPLIQIYTKSRKMLCCTQASGSQCAES